MKDLIYSEIKKCKIVYDNNYHLPNDSPTQDSYSLEEAYIPTLKEIIDMLPDEKILFLDLKSLPVLSLLDAVTALLTEKKAWSKVVLLSPHDICLECLYEKFPQSQMFEPRSRTSQRLLTFRNEGKCCCDDRYSHYVGFEISREMIVEDMLNFGNIYNKVNFKLWDDGSIKCTKIAKGNDVKIVFISVNNKDEYKQAKRLGAYAIFTTNPVSLLENKEEFENKEE